VIFLIKIIGVVTDLFHCLFIQHIKEFIMSSPSTFSDTVILVTREGMGSAEPSLQLKLLATYLALMVNHELPPAAICFYTEGVKLVIEDSPLLDLLQKLETMGVRLIVCSTCLDFFGITDKVKVGIVGGMTDIVEAQARAAKVITI